MSFEMDTVKFTKTECIDVLAKYVGMKPLEITIIIELLIKLGVISEYVFAEEKKS